MWGKEVVVVDLTLGYQRVAAPGMTATRRRVVLMLRIAAAGMLAFALLVGWEMFNRVVVHWRMVSTSSPIPSSGVGAYRITSTWVRSFQWGNLVWVVAAMIGPMLFAGAYGFLARAIQWKRDRSLTVLALTLSVLHTLGATLCLLLFALAAYANVGFSKWSVATVVEATACFLAVAMVPGMFYLSMRLMDLLGERVLPKAAATGTAEAATDLPEARGPEDRG